MAGERFIHDDRYVESFSNTDHVVLGRRLDPYCLWHQLNLEVIQSPILLGHSVSLLDLWMAVRICTSPWSPSQRVPDLKAPNKVWFALTVGRYDVFKEAKKFEDYLNDFVSAPKFWPNHHKQQGGAPDRDFDENLELALFLVHETTFTWRDVWTMPLGVLKWAEVGVAKLKGADIPIWTPEHEEMFQQHVAKREAGIDARAKEIAAQENIPLSAAHRKAFDEYWDKVTTAYGNTTKPEYRPKFTEADGGSERG